MAADAFRCADSSESRDEPIYGTASVVTRWLFLEQPGAWGHDALAASRLPEAVAQELRGRCRAAGIRMVLIRRGVRFSGEQRQCYVARTDERMPYLAHLALDSAADLLDVDLTPLTEGRPVTGATERTQPLFLVCTHGRHDACCSIRGNQVSRTACATSGADAWECSHIGGDRFAANVVCFPHGVYYGRVGSHDVVGLMESYGRGSISLDHYRGRCCYGFAVQAAEYFVRRETGLVRVDDLWLAGPPSAAGRELSATFAMRDQRLAEVKVRVEDTPGAYRLTCGSRGSSVIPRYELSSCIVRDD